MSIYLRDTHSKSTSFEISVMLFYMLSFHLDILQTFFIAEMDIFSEKEADRQIQDISSTDEPRENKKTDQSDSVFGKNLRSPILGYHYELPDLPTSYVPSITLDTSLLHVRLTENQQCQFTSDES